MYFIAQRKGAQPSLGVEGRLSGGSAIWEEGKWKARCHLGQEKGSGVQAEVLPYTGCGAEHSLCSRDFAYVILYNLILRNKGRRARCGGSCQWLGMM